MSHSDAAGMGMHSTREQQYTFNLKKKSQIERRKRPHRMLRSNKQLVQDPHP